MCPWKISPSVPSADSPPRWRVTCSRKMSSGASSRWLWTPPRACGGRLNPLVRKREARAEPSKRGIILPTHGNERENSSGCLFDSPFSHFWSGPTMVLRGRLFGFAQSPHGIYVALGGHDAAVVGAGSRDLQQAWLGSRSHRHTHRRGRNERLDCGRST